MEGVHWLNTKRFQLRIYNLHAIVLTAALLCHHWRASASFKCHGVSADTHNSVCKYYPRLCSTLISSPIILFTLCQALPWTTSLFLLEINYPALWISSREGFCHFNTSKCPHLHVSGFPNAEILMSMRGIEAMTSPAASHRDVQHRMWECCLPPLIVKVLLPNSSGTANKTFYKCENSKQMQPLHIFKEFLKLRSFLITPSTSAHLWVLKRCFLIGGRLHSSDTSQHPQMRPAAPHRHHTQCQWSIAFPYWAAGWWTGIFSKWSRCCPLLPIHTLPCPSLHLGWLQSGREPNHSHGEYFQNQSCALVLEICATCATCANVLVPNISSWNLLILRISSDIFPQQATFPRVTFTHRSTHIGPDPVGPSQELWDHVEEDPCRLSRLCPPNCSPLCPNSHTWFKRWAFGWTTFTLGPVCLGCP